MKSNEEIIWNTINQYWEEAKMLSSKSPQLEGLIKSSDITDGYVELDQIQTAQLHSRSSGSSAKTKSLIQVRRSHFCDTFLLLFSTCVVFLMIPLVASE